MYFRPSLKDAIFGGIAGSDTPKADIPEPADTADAVDGAGTTDADGTENEEAYKRD
jgi:hypothetical protein